MPQFRVLKRNEDERVLTIGTRNTREEAKQLAETFNAEWPGEYGIQEEGAGKVSIEWLF